MAERVGFEPTEPFRALRFSRPTHSATLPPLQARLKVANDENLNQFTNLRTSFVNKILILKPKLNKAKFSF